MNNPEHKYATYVPADYKESRQRFRRAVRARNAVADPWLLPGGNDLTLDVARIGPADVENLVIVSCGLHGGEGPFGAGVQLAALERYWPENVAVLFLHALNPFGFANHRRTDADNVDLNRNFLKEGTPYRGTPAEFDRVNSVVNPTRPPRKWELYDLQMFWLEFTLGKKKLRQAIAAGQFENPCGLFYGGSGPSPLMELLDRELPAWLGPAERVIHLDFHTGLGEYGSHVLLIAHPPDSQRFQRWQNRFGDVVESCGAATSYANIGGIDEWLETRFPGIQFDSVCAEFGTYSFDRVIGTLREENLAWFYTEPGSKARLKAAREMGETFVPEDPGWRHAVVEDGLELVLRATEVLAS